MHDMELYISRASRLYLGELGLSPTYIINPPVFAWVFCMASSQQHAADDEVLSYGASWANGVRKRWHFHPSRHGVSLERVLRLGRSCTLLRCGAVACFGCCDVFCLRLTRTLSSVLLSPDDREHAEIQVSSFVLCSLWRSTRLPGPGFLLKVLTSDCLTMECPPLWPRSLFATSA